MKHLTKYKVFESSQSNEYYFDMIYLLQDVFDDFDVIPKTDENIPDEVHQEFGDYETPGHKFWSIRLLDTHRNDADISNMSEVGDRSIKYIIVFNITKPEKEAFKKRLNEVGDRFVEQTGMRYKVDEEELDGYLFDYVIKVKIPPGVDNI